MEKDNHSEWERQLKPNLFEDIVKFSKEHPDEYEQICSEEYPWGRHYE